MAGAAARGPGARPGGGRAMQAAVVVLAVATHVRSVGYPLFFDDPVAAGINPDVTGAHPWPLLFRNNFWGQPLAGTAAEGTVHHSYRPVPVLIWRLCHTVAGGSSPALLHALNVALHTLVCWLAHGLFHGIAAACYHEGRLSKAPGAGEACDDRDATPTTPAPTSPLLPGCVADVAGLLFAVHPIQTEVVCGVVGFAELLCAAFAFSALAALLAHFPGHATARPGATAVLPATWLGLTAVLGALALFSKETGIMALPTVLVADWLVVTRFDALRALGAWRRGQALSRPDAAFLVRAAALLATTCALVGLRLAINMADEDGGDLESNPALKLKHRAHRILTKLHYNTVHAHRLALPFGLAADYSGLSIPVVESVFGDPRNLASLGLLLAVLLAAVLSACPSLLGGGSRATAATRGPSFACRLALAGTALVVVPFLLSTHLFVSAGYVVAERLLFQPSAGAALLLSAALLLLAQRVILPHVPAPPAKHGRRRRRRERTTRAVLALLAVGVLQAFVVGTLQRGADWRGAFSLYDSGSRVFPTNCRMLYNRAFALREEHSELVDLEEGMLDRAYAACPYHRKISINFQALYLLQHRHHEILALTEAVTDHRIRGLEGFQYHMGTPPEFYFNVALGLLHTFRFDKAIRFAGRLREGDADADKAALLLGFAQRALESPKARRDFELLGPPAVHRHLARARSGE